jgi:predicted O-linked N-acetylglucosamine transferase (SPINDLY family)
MDVAAIPIQEAYRQAAAAFRAGDLEGAQARCRGLLRQQPDHFEALSLLGIVAAHRGDAAEALRLLERAAAVNPESAVAHNNLGNALRDSRRYDDALRAYRRALEIDPGYASAHLNLGILLMETGRPAQALPHLDTFVARQPADPLGHLRRGMALLESGRADEALVSIDRALALAPAGPAAHTARGAALRALRRHTEALGAYERAVALAPNDGIAHYNRGVALAELGRLEEAATSYRRAIALRPDLADAHHNLGNICRELKRHREAIESYKRALSLRPDYPFLVGALLFTRHQICDWSDTTRATAEIEARALKGEAVTPPFALLSLSGSAAAQRQAAAVWGQRKIARSPECAAPPRRQASDRIRVGYYSRDFRNHAVSYLLVQMFELHDRRRFEWIGFSFGPARDDPMRRRVAAAFDRFIDADAMSDAAVARLSREIGIDVAVDLTGFTDGARTGVFACRPAPVQVSYMGFPGTLGVEFIDYLIADPVLVPAGAERFYAERIVRLPSTYMASDRSRSVSARHLTRAEAGLPPQAFVFCCFNNSYKILPDRFEQWMRILARVDGSVLWLLLDNAHAADNLRAAARRSGIAPERLVFAPRVSVEEHLARHRLADLFLDTAPYGAHTSANDALWMGVPVLTCPGETFASRVAASLLHAAGLPELVVPTAERYEAVAVELARDARLLARLRARLEAARDDSPLFDTLRLTRQFEAAYAEMHRRHVAGLPPEHLSIAA